MLENDSDPEGDPLTANPITGVANGTLALNAAGSFTYVPNAGFSGPDSFTFFIAQIAIWPDHSYQIYFCPFDPKCLRLVFKFTTVIRKRDGKR